MDLLFATVVFGNVLILGVFIFWSKARVLNFLFLAWTFALMTNCMGVLFKETDTQFGTDVNRYPLLFLILISTSIGLSLTLNIIFKIKTK